MSPPSRGSDGACATTQALKSKWAAERGVRSSCRWALRGTENGRRGDDLDVESG